MASTRALGRRAGNRHRPRAAHGSGRRGRLGRFAEGLALLLVLAVVAVQVLVPLHVGRRRGDPRSQAKASRVFTAQAASTPQLTGPPALADPAAAFQHIIESDTAFMRMSARTGGDSDDHAAAPTLDVLAAGTGVTLLEYGPEMSVILTTEGSRGRVPTMRLRPRPVPAKPPAPDVGDLFDRRRDEAVARAAARAAARGAGPGARPGGGAEPAAVQQAIDRGLRYVLMTQGRDGSWEPPDGQLNAREHGVLTSLATLTLLEAGQSPVSPPVANALDYLRQQELGGVYAMSLRAQAWALIARAEGSFAAGRAREQARASLREDEARLRASVERAGFDLRSAQVVAQGLLACAEVGVESPPDFLKLQAAVWARTRNPDGGWDLGDAGGSTPAMTAAGVATLLAIGDLINPTAGVRRDGNPLAGPADGALAWLDEHFGGAADDERLLAAGDYRLLDDVSRAARLAGRKRFGQTDWFAAGAAWLTGNQNPDGSWGGEPDPRRPALAGGGGGPQRLRDTCLALQFLLRGRVAPVTGKLWYAGPWNQRPRDVADFTARGQRDGLPAWQVVGLASSPPEDFADVPVLYMSGNEAFEFDRESVEKLKAYVDGGGLLLGNADCGDRAFAGAFEALGRRMYPHYEFRTLSDAHPIHSNQEFVASKLRRRLVLTGLSNGVRELMLLVPSDDAGRSWLRAFWRTEEDRYRAGLNIVSYAADAPTRARQRGEGGGRVARDPQADVAAPAAIHVARVMAGTNPDPEPGGWRRLAAVMRASDGVDLAVKEWSLDAGVPDGCRVAHRTGTTAFKLTPAERDELRRFVIDGGGTLVVDAAGGSPAFADAAHAELEAIFGAEAAAQRARPLPADHPSFTRPGAEITRVEYRRFALARLGGGGGGGEQAGAGGDAPRLRGIAVNGRTAVFFSREDLSAGLVGDNVDGVLGYTPDTAAAIMRNLLLYAARR